MVAALCVLPALGMLRVPLWFGDEALLLVYPEQLSLGRVPNQDFFTVYGPGGYRLLEAVFALTGPNLLAERSVGAAYHVAIAFGVMWLVWRLGRTASLGAGITSAVVLGPLVPVAFAWLGGLALATWSLALLANGERTRTTVAAGVLGGLVSFWRPEMLVLVLGALPLTWSRRRFPAYSLGLVVGALPMVEHVLSTGSAVYDNVVRSRLAINAQANLGQVPGTVWLTFALCILTVLYLCIRVLRGAACRSLGASAAITSLLLLPQGFQRIETYHAMFVACFILPVGAGLVSGWPPTALRRLLAAQTEWQRRLIRVVAATTIGVFLLPAMTTALTPVTKVTSAGRWVYASPQDKTHLDATIAAVRRLAPPGSRVFIGARDLSVPVAGGVEMQLYHLLPDYSAHAYYLELPPGVAEKRGSPLMTDVISADVLVLTENSAALREAWFPYLGRGDESVNKAVTMGFCPAGRVGATTVFLRRGRC